MKASWWTILVLSVLVMLLLLTGLTNTLLDPAWLTGSQNHLNKFRYGYDERQQKVNHLQFVTNNYNALILGSSRSTYLQGPDANELRFFNFSANSMGPSEYLPYLTYFTEQTGAPPNVVVLGLDFWGTNANDTADFKAPTYYVQQAQKPLYRLQTQLSIDMLQQGLSNACYSVIKLPDDQALYDHHFVKQEYGFNQVSFDQRVRTQSKYYRETAYGNYRWRANYSDLLLELTNQYPETKFMVYTTPVTDSLLSILVAQNRLVDYYKWLDILVDVFGEVKHCMIPHQGDTDRLFYDLQHFKPEMANAIMQELTEPVGDHYCMTLRPDVLPKAFTDLDSLFAKFVLAN